MRSSAPWSPGSLAKKLGAARCAVLCAGAIAFCWLAIARASTLEARRPRRAARLRLRARASIRFGHLESLVTPDGDSSSSFL